MKKKTYINPDMEVVSMESGYFLDEIDGFSEKLGESSIINDGELDANGSQFWDFDIPGNKLWDE